MDALLKFVSWTNNVRVMVENSNYPLLPFPNYESISMMASLSFMSLPGVREECYLRA